MNVQTLKSTEKEIFLDLNHLYNCSTTLQTLQMKESHT